MLLLLAVLCMVLGHVFKIKRWGLYISVYEKPDEANLLNAIALGHSINMVLPMKLLPVRFGDIVRFIWSGRKLKNGYPFSLATVIADLYIDLLTVGSMFFGLSLIGKGGEGLLRVARIYMNAFVFVIPFTALCILFRKTVKKVIRAIASIFNEKIEFYLLYLTYLCISSLKDICVHIDKKKFVIHSVFMWLSYVASYVIFAEVVQSLGFYYSTSDIFTKLFSGFNLYNIERGLIPVWGCYLLSPLVVCWIFSVIFSRKVDKSRARGGVRAGISFLK